MKLLTQHVEQTRHWISFERSRLAVNDAVNVDSIWCLRHTNLPVSPDQLLPVYLIPTAPGPSDQSQPCRFQDNTNPISPGRPAASGANASLFDYAIGGRSQTRLDP